jgi:hypothetical protein
MNRRGTRIIVTIALLLCGLVPPMGGVGAQTARTLTEQIVGVWTIVSTDTVVSRRSGKGCTTWAISRGKPSSLSIGGRRGARSVSPSWPLSWSGST